MDGWMDGFVFTNEGLASNDLSVSLPCSIILPCLKFPPASFDFGVRGCQAPQRKGRKSKHRNNGRKGAQKAKPPARERRQQERPGQGLVLEAGGVTVAIEDEAAVEQLGAWARQLAAEGSVSHAQAVARERLVAGKVAAGEWEPSAFHAYQRLAAGTGNVDSADLLLHYAIVPAVAASQQPLHRAAAACDMDTLRDLLQEQHVFADTPLPDGTTVIRHHPKLCTTLHHE